MESIIDYLKRNLLAAGSRRWAAIAAHTGCAHSLLRKIAYGDRDDPRLSTVQPLIAYFLAVDRGEQTLPEPAETAKPEAAAQA
jgi:hypothetical protein